MLFEEEPFALCLNFVCVKVRRAKEHSIMELDQFRDSLTVEEFQRKVMEHLVEGGIVDAMKVF